MTATVIFRTDASADIGLGHVMRCRALAEAIVERGGRAIFSMLRPPPAVADAVTAIPAELVVHEAAPGGKDDLAGLLDLAARTRPRAVVVDGYHFSADYLGRIDEACRLVVIDDMAALDRLPSRMILNASPAANSLPYDRLAPDAVKLLGPRYVLLRRDIRRAAVEMDAPIAQRQSILITFGGSDPLGLTSPVMEALASQLPDRTFLDVLVGAGNSQADRICSLARQLGPQIRVSVNPPSVAPLFAAAGLAVTAAGGTVAELAAMGVPALAVLVARNQEGAAAKSPYPCIDGRAPGTVAAIATATLDLWNDLDARMRLAASVDGLIDGQGAVRAADAILALSNPAPQGRPVPGGRET